jgi:hypothetical protein
MAVGSGIGGSFGVAKETTYGTAVTVNRWYEVESVSLKRNKRTVQGGGLSGGTLIDRAARRVQPTSDASGAVELEVTTKTFGLLLEQILGSATAGAAYGTSGFEFGFSVGDNVGKSLSAQVGVPRLTGTVVPYSFEGVKVTAAEFTCEIDGLLMCTLEMDARVVRDNVALTTPVYTTGLLPFHFGQASVLIGATTGAAAVVQGVRGFSLRIERPMANERFYFGNAGLKSEPISNGKIAVTGSFDADFVDNADFANRFRDDTSTAAIIRFVTSESLGGGMFSGIEFVLPAVFFDTDQPTLDDEDVVSTSYDFTALRNDAGTSPLDVFYRTSDSSL